MYLSPLQRFVKFVVNIGLYLESGFLNLGSTAQCAESTFLPASLTFTAPIAAYMSTSTTPLQGTGGTDAANAEPDTPFYGEVLTNGQQSKTLTGALSNTVTDLCSNVYTNPSDIYGNATTYQCKYAQRYVPASLYSGKLRLFVQSIYGSTRQDYTFTSLTLNPAAKTYDLVVDGYRLQQGIHTTGLFTDSDYNYYLIEVDPNQITFRKLKLNSTAAGWVTLLSTHPNKTNRQFSSKVEAYILSQAKIDPDFTPVVSATGLSVTEGAPYAYGFHFNWSGNQAKCVWHRSIGDGTYRSRIITLDIADDLTVSATQSAEQAWSNNEHFQFWYPDMLDEVMKTAGVITSAAVNTAGCPMYGYYGFDDVWQQFEIVRSISNSDPTYDTGILSQSDLDGNWGNTPIEHSYLRRYGSTQLNGNIGYNWNGGSDVAPVSVNVSIEEHTDPTFYNPVTPNNSGSASPYSSTGGLPNGPLLENGQYLHPWLVATWPASGKTQGWAIRDYGGLQYHWDSTLSPPYNAGISSYWPCSNDQFAPSFSVTMNNSYSITGASERCKVMFAVPFGDCETIIYGMFKGRVWGNKGVGTATYSGAIKRPTITLCEVISTTGYSPTLTSNYITQNLAQTMATATPALLFSHTSTGPGAESETTVMFDSSATTGWTHINTDGYIIDHSTDSTSSPPSWADKYFSHAGGPPGYDPNTPLMQARASANGAHILYHEEGIGKNENGFPDGVYSSSGWA